MLCGCAITATIAEGASNAWVEGKRLAASVEGFGDEPVGRAYVVTYRSEPIAVAAPYARPNIGTGRYATWYGGADPGQFAYNGMTHSVLFARPMAQLFPSSRSLFTYVSAACLADLACAGADAARADEVAAAALRWDSVILVEAPDAFVEDLVSRGFVRSAPSVLRPRPASVTVTVELESLPPAGPLVFRAGYPNTIGFFRGGRIAASELQQEQLELRFDDLPAGPIVVEAFVDADLDGAMGPSDELLFQRSVVVVPDASMSVSAAP